MMWRILIAGCMAIAVSGSSYASNVPKTSIEGSFIYSDAERMNLFSFEDGHTIVGPISPKTPIGDQKGQFVEFLGAETNDCSDDRFKCVAADQNILAIPRKNLSDGMEYTVNGTIFTVKECLRSAEKLCQVALIEGDCQLVRLAEGLRECATYPGGRKKSPQQGAVHYFIYNEDYGVTAFGLEDDKIEKISEMRMSAQNYILQGNIGLLGPESDGLVKN
jgi:hypothetical protein